MKRCRKILVFVILLILVVAVVVGTSYCRFFLNNAEKVTSTISFNYPGLRIETRNINVDEIRDNFPRIVCFGDSVTFGWNLKYSDSYPVLLENLLLQDYPQVRVINSGIGGNTILDACKRLNSDIFYYEPDVVIINFGLNDGMLFEVDRNKSVAKESLLYDSGDGYYTPQVDLVTFYKCYNDVIEQIESRDIKLIIVGPNPVLDCFPLLEDEEFRKKQREIYDLYNKKIIEIGESRGIICVNLWGIFVREDKIGDYMQEDCIHPNKSGLKLVADNIYSTLKLYNVLGQIETN